MATVNEEFFDAIVRHQIFLMRLSGSIRNDVIKLLDATEVDIAARIRSDLLNNKGFSRTSLRKLQTLEKYISTVRLKAWQEIDEVWLTELTELAKAEPEFVSKLLKTTVPVILDTVIPPAPVLEAIVTSAPFEGKTMHQWSKTIAAQDITRITNQIKIGMVQGQTSAQIARRVVGTVRLNGKDGVTEISRRHAATLTRTAVNHISNTAKRSFYKANESIFTGELYVATLDSRTSPICRSLDGKTFPVAVGPIPPMHFNCRSVRVGIIGKGPIGRRPAKATTQKKLLRDYTKENNLKPVSSRSNLPRGHKGKFDAFSGVEIRKATGTVPAKVSYQQWLGRQSVEFQDDVLGKTKGKLFRKGDLTLDRFVNRSGDELNLHELSVKHADAFRAAGLDPEDF